MIISTEEQIRKRTIYLMAWSILRNLYFKHSVDIKVLERVNEKNAEKMNCMVQKII